MTSNVKFEGIPREMIALRVSKEIKDGDYVNLGIGIPTLVSNWIEGRDIILQSEIGMLKTGPLAEGADVNQDLINASCQPVVELAGTVYFDILESFTMIRGGKMDVVVMGAMQ
ncbi:MAG: 3-oxoadipate CoA-transferase, partial [Dehalococcoidales bacterium]|nr:3-oxoadipate CoA-transferase [Dehalococcoidales bacterium]